jgi:hypothetical protein
MKNRITDVEPTSVAPAGSNALVGGSTIKPDCSRHKKEVAGVTDMKLLADMIGDLHYESLEEMLSELVLKLIADSYNDWKGERKQLSNCLENAASYIGMARREISKAWKISEPYMK